MRTYDINIPGLAESIASTPISKEHAKLVEMLRTFDGLGDACIVTTRGDSWLVRRKVLDANGVLVHDDHEAWLRQQVEVDGGDIRQTRSRIGALGYFLTRCELTALYIVHDHQTSNQADFLQLEVYVENEFVDCKLFAHEVWRHIEDLRDLISDSQGMELSEKRPFRPNSYRLHRAVDVGQFVDVLDDVEAGRRAVARTRDFVFTNVSTGKEEVMTMDQVNPGWDRYSSKERRLFQDWARSSAGISGARFCMHWVAQLSDYTDPKGERWLSLIPMWTFTQKMAKIEGGKGSVYELYGKLEKMDLRTRVPFGWFFFMLHGNKMEAIAGRRVLKAAEDGLLFLPEHDYQVLASWKASEYAF